MKSAQTCRLTNHVSMQDSRRDRKSVDGVRCFGERRPWSRRALTGSRPIPRIAGARPRAGTSLGGRPSNWKLDHNFIRTSSEPQFQGQSGEKIKRARCSAASLTQATRRSKLPMKSSCLIGHATDYDKALRRPEILLLRG
jgi:hypothetical protein